MDNNFFNKNNADCFVIDDKQSFINVKINYLKKDIATKQETFLQKGARAQNCYIKIYKVMHLLHMCVLYVMLYTFFLDNV